jgi:hypothetical protein
MEAMTAKNHHVSLWSALLGSKDILKKKGREMKEGFNVCKNKIN